MLRLLVSILLGIAVTFGLFVFMAELIANSARAPEEPSPPVVLDLVVSKKEAKAHIRKRPPPPPPPPKTPPKTPPVEPEPVESDAPAVNLAPPSFSSKASGGGFTAPVLGKQDGDAQPIVRLEPKYPTKARRDGIEGYVVLKFVVLEDGSVSDIEVIEAKPKRIFNREAIRALKKWKYKPKIVDGKAVKQTGITPVRLDFTLDQE